MSKGGTGASNIPDALTNLGISKATTAEFLNNTPDKLLETDQVNAAGAYVPLTFGASIPWNMALGFNAYVTLTATAALALPTNMIVGRSGILEVTQGGSGSYLLTLAAGWKGGPVTLSTAVGAIDLVFYVIKRGSIPVITGVKRNVG